MGLFSHNHQQKTISSNNLKYKLGFEFMMFMGGFCLKAYPAHAQSWLFSDDFQSRPPHSNPSQVLHLDRWCAIASPTR